MGDPSAFSPLDDEALYPPAAILIVDDRPANLLAVEAILGPLGHRIVAASTGQEAIAHAEGEEFAVILMDVHMPLVDGFETVARLRRANPTCPTPIVFMSAVYDDSAHVQQGYSLGAVDYLAKPTDPTVLRAKVASFVSLFRRGQELKRRAAVIREQKEAAVRAETSRRLRDTYFAIIGHDLRNPMSVIAMAAARLRTAESPEKCHALADRIDRAVTRANAIVRDVLDFTRGELGGGIPVTRAPADFGDVARSIVHDMALLHPERQLDLETSGNLQGTWDRDRVEQALSNLIVNAVKHGSGAVSVAVREDDSAVVLAVHNSGAINPDTLSTLFEPFHHTSAKDGLGLGLYIVREIVVAHGGRIEVTSSEQEGTTFVSVWPRS